MNKVSEQDIKDHCPHCDPKSQALKNVIEETQHFRVVCDRYPICEGHLLIIPKKHLSCVGEYEEALFLEFSKLYNNYQQAIKGIYGKVSTFEHGKIGQTVFHSHAHILPFSGEASKIVPEGRESIKLIFNLKELKEVYDRTGGYLFFSIEDKAWLADAALAEPGFFRDRFAQALGRPERGNWKQMSENKTIMAKAEKEIENFKLKIKKSTF